MDAIAQTVEALYGAGHWLIERDRHREAISLFRTMLLVDGRDERGWLGLVTCHEQLDEHEKAIALCELATVACEGGSIRCCIARARLRRALGDYEQATEAYEEAARLAERLDETELAQLIAREVGTS